MTIGEICTKSIVTADRDTTVQSAATLMRERHVGNVIVVDGKKPIGIVTDRDIVVGVIATGLDAKVITIGDIMGPGLTRAHMDDDVFMIVHKMSREGIRRMPVVNEASELTGVFALDDFLRILAREMLGVSRLIVRERKHETKARIALSA